MVLRKLNVFIVREIIVSIALDQPHTSRHLKVCASRKVTMRKQKNLNFQAVDNNVDRSLVGPLLNFGGEYDQAKMRKAIAHWILMHEHPFMVVEEEAKISRKTIKSECIEVYESKKKKLKIENVRESVKFINQTEARLRTFSEIVEQLQLGEIRWIVDCPTRWNSTYEMLSCALKFKDIFPRFQDREPTYDYLPSLDEWEKVEKICEILEVFNVVTKIISGSNYPTSNLYLSEVYRILDEYVVMNNVRIGNEASSSGGSLDASTSSGSHSSSSSGWSKLMNYVRQVEVFSSPRSELENYLEDGVYICETSQYDFDVLEWWKINNLKFWFLSKMAADILAIPISIVASESTFSAGGRVIDSYRSSLATNIVQALICGGDRVRIHGVKKIQKAEKKPMEVVLPIS
ncbi:hypothetical protein H6P81_020318 [Aristolochia fimbriata]|uniref:HAT C-terminal dimerisation domain-containing protein n=1 Tax=Aristolochia fimbriata TaxID=158543 RepID=A0AAV7DU79_ARIFI|nr:hypothetical protein H6P81_020318 [Aristolochia fimbriata]